MKILITGNQGYVGPGVVKEFRIHYPDAELIGFDIGYYSKFITTSGMAPEAYLNVQHYGDVRAFPEHILEGVDTIVSLAAISNDPIGNKFEKATFETNFKATIEIAKMAKRKGVRNFVFASSCSVYGAAEDIPRTETSDLNPLTAYAKSKVYTENELADLADNDFKITCHRFATACGMSDRLRLDLVVNDFVACAATTGEITILSDGTPWRPLINVLDMARAIRWSHEREPENGGNFLIVNTGSENWNYRVKELAQSIHSLLPKVKVSINKDAEPDKRSYKVDFSLFKKLAPSHQPRLDLISTINNLFLGLNEIGFKDADFRNSNFMRLIVINDLISKGFIDRDLKLI